MAYTLNPFTGTLDYYESGSGSGPTNLGYVASTRELTSSTGTDVFLPEVTTTNAGLLSAADKVKLNASSTRPQSLGLVLAMNSIPPSS